MTQIQTDSKFSVWYNLELDKHKWLGVDRHQKILYGVKYPATPDGEFELKKLELFTGKFVTFKKINFKELLIEAHLSLCNLPGCNNFDSWNCSDCSLSNDGQFIAVLFIIDELVCSSQVFVFCLFEIETDKVSIYYFPESDDLKIYRAQPKAGFVTCAPMLMCSNENEWILAQDWHNFYHIVLDAGLHEAFMQHLPQLPGEPGLISFLSNKMVVVQNLTKMMIYDFASNQWETLLTVTTNLNFHQVLTETVFTQNNYLFAACLRNEVLFKFDMGEKLWSRNCVVDNKRTNRVVASSPTFIITSPNILNRSMHGFVHLVNFSNALSLRDICFLKLVKHFDPTFNRFNLLTDDDIVQNMPIFANLSEYLKRCYFGPAWMRGQK